MSLNLQEIRQEYSKKGLSVEDCLDSPLDQFDIWLQEAISAKVIEPTAMNLATVDENKRPSSRIVLLKGLEKGEFVFYSNYLSRKGMNLSHLPFAALTFFWAELERQVRIEGKVIHVSDETSDAYFKTRPYTSRLGAWVSEQSKVIPNKASLVKRAVEVGIKHPFSVPRPPHWGGFALIPDRIEFWQGRPSRLHDRVVYRLIEDESGSEWIKERLAP